MWSVQEWPLVRQGWYTLAAKGFGGGSGPRGLGPGVGPDFLRSRGHPGGSGRGPEVLCRFGQELRAEEKGMGRLQGDGGARNGSVS